MDLNWNKLDAVAFSWQKGLGGEAGFGSVVLSPRALERLESYKPNRPIPRIFRMAEDKQVNMPLFEGYMINTPSMLCLEDFRNALIWADNLGGIGALVQKTEQNYETVCRFIAGQSVFRFLVDEKYRARHVACLDIASEVYQSLSEEGKWTFLKKIVGICEQERTGFDCLWHIRTKPHLRIWIGPTVDAENLGKFFPRLPIACAEAVAECF
jgi:phosphoserine aminotransferase